MAIDSAFDSIRPYQTENEIHEAVQRLITSDDFLGLFTHLTNAVPQKIIESLLKVHSLNDFQKQAWGPIIRGIIKRSSNGVTVDGMANILPSQSYTFITNHRDIILDSSILNVLLREYGMKYCQAAIGNNLFVNQWVVDLVKLNSCFTIERDVPLREMIASSSLRAAYMHNVIKEGKNSIWIAQREGRTKNGNDQTQPAVLKMFKMSGPKDVIENYKELNITPVSISYEWEPCDVEKTTELYIRSTGVEYVKTKAADMYGMAHGMDVNKGRIHFSIGEPLYNQLDEITKLQSNGERIDEVVRVIDKQIHGSYKLWPNNYIAYDLQNGRNKYINQYTSTEKGYFIQTMDQKLESIKGDKAILQKIFLGIYANPVLNKESVMQSKK